MVASKKLISPYVSACLTPCMADAWLGSRSAGRTVTVIQSSTPTPVLQRKENVNAVMSHPFSSVVTVLKFCRYRGSSPASASQVIYRNF